MSVSGGAVADLVPPGPEFHGELRPYLVAAPDAPRDFAGVNTTPPNAAKREKSNDEYLAAARRFIRAAGRRAEDDIDMLRGLVDLREDLDDTIAETICVLRREQPNGQPGFSWRDIASRLGLQNHQWVMRKWGRRHTRRCRAGVPPLGSCPACQYAFDGLRLADGLED